MSTPISLFSTKKKIDDIGNELHKDGIEVTKYEVKAANEESLKKLDGNSPDILHIAMALLLTPLSR